jgi:hypothetical protein
MEDLNGFIGRKAGWSITVFEIRNTESAVDVPIQEPEFRIQEQRVRSEES